MTPPMRVLDTGLMSARRNIAVSAALAELHRAGLVPDTLRFSTYPAAVLLGRHQRLPDVVRLKACRRHHVEIVRRVTGSGAFYAGAGVLAWDLVAERHHFAGRLDTVRER